MTSGIYYIKNKTTGKKYIGSSYNIRGRFNTHRYELRHNKHRNPYLQHAWNKYGEGDFEFGVEEEVVREMLLEVEQQYIDKNVGGYNLAPAGGGDILSNHPDKEQIIKKISNTVKRKWSERTEEELERRYGHTKGSGNPNWRNGGVTFKDCPVCGKTRIQANYNSCGKCRDRTGENNPFYGRKHSDETIEKLRKINTGKVLSEAAKQAITGENSVKFMGYYHTPWGVFPSSSQAQNAHDYMLSATIHRWCLAPDKVITKSASTRSKYLKENGGHDISGKTYRDLGFWFEPKQP